MLVGKILHVEVKICVEQISDSFTCMLELETFLEFSQIKTSFNKHRIKQEAKSELRKVQDFNETIVLRRKG